MTYFEISILAGISVVSIALLLALYRFFKGPTLPDRVTAFDLIAANFIAITCIFAVLVDNPAFMDVAIVLSLIAFLGAMSFAYYLGNRRKIRDNQAKEDQNKDV